MEGAAPKGEHGTAAMTQDFYTDLEEKLARAQCERDEALERKKATAEVLRVISSSLGELKAVFQAMLANAVRLCEAKFGNFFLHEGARYASSRATMFRRSLSRRAGGATRIKVRLLPM